MSDQYPTNEFPAPQQPPPGFAAAAPLPVAPGPPGGQPGGSRRLTLVLVGAIGVVVGAGIGVAVTVAADDGSTPQAGSSASAAASSGGTGQQGKNAQKGKRNVARGTITAVSGSSWTMKTLEGDTVTVTITSATKYGSNDEPATKADYPVGTKVVVAGKKGVVVDGSVTAVRVRDLPDHAGQNKKQSATTPAPSASPS